MLKIETSTGADIAWIFDVEGEDGFRKREARALESLLDRTKCVISTGGGVVLSTENRTILSNLGYVVYLQTSVASQIERTRRDKKRPLLRVADPVKVLSEMKEARDPLYEATADWSIVTDSSSVKSVGSAIVDHIQGLTRPVSYS